MTGWFGGRICFFCCRPKLILSYSTRLRKTFIINRRNLSRNLGLVEMLLKGLVEKDFVLLLQLLKLMLEHILHWLHLTSEHLLQSFHVVSHWLVRIIRTKDLTSRWCLGLLHFLRHNIIYLFWELNTNQNPSLVSQSFTFWEWMPLTSSLPILSVMGALLHTFESSLLNASTSPKIFLTTVSCLEPPVLRSVYTGKFPVWVLSI